MTFTSKLSAIVCFAGFGCEARERPCVLPQLTELGITIQPPPAGPGLGEVSFQGPCRVQEVLDAPLSLALSCEGSPGFDMTLTVTGATGEVSWVDELPLYSDVELRFATVYGVSESPAWVTVRRAGESDPSLIVVKSTQPLPWFQEAADFMAPVELEFLDDADCEETKGSCGHGVRRRTAVELSIPGEKPAVAFGQNQDTVGSYHLRVGNAEVDHGNCEGVSQTWYEVLITRQSNP